MTQSSYRLHYRNRGKNGALNEQKSFEQNSLAVTRNSC
uniref:Uncharacterized protein n=1 Tax=Arundo donax TaxID=35708 RepID=A0A0A8YPG9_ARUDO